MERFRRCYAVLAACISLILLSSPLVAWAAEVGVTDKEILVGAGMDLTGAVANWGVNIKAGMEAVFNRVNEAGGVHGRKIKLITYDHVYQPPKAVANAKRLVERDKVFIMMGHLGTPTTKAIMGYLEEQKVPNIYWRNTGSQHGVAPTPEQEYGCPDKLRQAALDLPHNRIGGVRHARWNIA